MDLNILRSIATVMMFVLFIGICIWAWGRRRQTEFDAAAQLPFSGDEAPTHRQTGEHQ